MTPFSLAPQQEERWIPFQRDPTFPWSVTLSTRLSGTLEVEALRAALASLVERHEILRMRFVSTGEGAPARMQIEPHGQAGLETRDWSALAPAERAAALRDLERELRAPYPLDGSAPLRAGLGRLNDEEHVLVLAQSSLASDWRSLWSLTQELLGVLAGEPERDEPVHFADLAQWLRATLEGEDAEAGFAEWKRFDLAAAGALRLPLEHDRGARAFALGEVTRELPSSLREALRGLAQGRNLPAQALLCAAWQAWLARATELETLVLGVRSAGRAFQGLERALGPLERALPVEARLDERVSLAQLARRTDEQLARGAEWHEFFRPARLGQAPEFAFRQVFEHLPAEPACERGGLRAEILRRDGVGEPFRGQLRVEENGEGIELRFAYDTRFLGEAEAGATLEPYLALLENALARPDAALASLSACSAEQERHLLELSRGPRLEPETKPDAPVHERILEAARARPDEVAIAAGGVELTYRELEQRSGALAVELEGLGVVPGTLVGVHLERSVELVVAILAVLRAGGAYLPLPPGYPRERVLFMLADAHAPLVIGSAETPAALEGYRGTFVPVHAPRPSAALAPRARVTPEDLAYVIYTSGSSGTPKGVPIAHANLWHSTRARLATYPGEVARYLLLSSFAFDSSVAGIFWTLVSGGTLVLPPEGFEKELASLPELIAAQRPSHLLALPSLWALVLEQAPPGALDSLACVIVAGESCSPELLRRHRSRLPRARLYNEYGPTEGTVWSTVFDTSLPFERAQVPIGRPIPGAACYVLTPEREPAPVGVAGELWIGGPGVALGYLDRPQLTRERFAEDPFAGGRMYRTGDRARWLVDGQLEFLGRLDHQVKIRGYRVELEEVEAALLAHPAVSEAIVLARSEGEGSPARLLAWVLSIGSRPAETDLLRYLAERLPEYMVPSRALCLESWPRLPNGKVDRQALPTPDESDRFEEPEGALEVVLAALWADVLGLEQVGRHDDFFALGGHSLSATRLYARLKETLQTRLPLRALFEHRTPAALAGALTREPAERERLEDLAQTILDVLTAELDADEEEHALGA